MSWRVRASAALVVVLGALAGAAGSAEAASFSAHGSVGQIYVTGATPGKLLAVYSRRGHRVARKRADAQGGIVFRKIKAGSGYRVRRSRRGESSGPITVLTKRSAPPSTSVYGQKIPSSGYGYLTTRDGTKLSIFVHPPQDVSSVLPGGIKVPHLPSGPTPTLIEYAGYGYADPAGPQSGISILANLMGFSVVDVNMRGTGCSGGSFDFFEPLQSLDGYDVIETVARQPWVLHNRVGMMGISYGGISQLFTAKTQPPSLAAISPLSVIDNTQTTLYPGGILNTGFALNWAKERVHDALPASATGGQKWAYKRIQEGDSTCRANQALHGEAVDLLKKVRDNNHYKPSVADPLSPVTFVKKINVPTFMACQFTDEQTGGHCPDLAEHFTGTSRKWFTFTNGTHVDSLDPETFNRWYDFLSLYVARKAPIGTSAVLHASSPLIYSEAMGIDGVQLPNDPIQQEPTYDRALAAFQRQQQIRVLFDNGAGDKPGHPLPAYEHSFSRFPVPGTTARSWFLGPGSTLGDQPPARSGKDRFRANPRQGSLTDFTGDTAGGTNGLWTATPPYHWNPKPGRNAASWITAPLSQNATVIGAGAIRVWIRSTRKNADLQATISEVRPDGKETFVQGGWLRGNERKLDRRKSTRLEPVLSLRKRDVRSLPRRKFTMATIPLYYQGHAYRAGSRIRLTISAPNGDQPIWGFEGAAPSKRTARIAIARSRRRPSSLTLPLVPGLSVPTGLPPCPGLRGEPCRPYRP